MIYTMSDGRVMSLRYRCETCGKLTAGRKPREHGRFYGDGSFYFPRYHVSAFGSPCPGIEFEAEWVEEEITPRPSSTS